MPRKAEDSFVVTLALRASQDDARTILLRLEIIRQIYNAVLGEALKRLRRMRASPLWQQARTMPKTVGGKPNQDRITLFREVNRTFGFTAYDLEAYATTCKNNAGFVQHLGAHETQKMAQRAFKAVQEHAFGKRGRPRFKGLRGIRSLEGKSNKAGLIWKGDRLEWGGLCLEALPASPKDTWLAEAMQAETKFCRLLRRTINGRDLFYVQLVKKGLPPRKNKNTLGKGTVGLDQGPTNLAVVADAQAHLVRLAATVEHPWAEKRRLQRALDRSRRASNPRNYNADGTVRPGPKTWVYSARGKDLQRRLAEIDRKLAAERKAAHGELQNDIIRLGDTFKFEKVSYTSFQRCFGKSTQVRGCGMFFDGLKLKAERAGAKVLEFPTRTTRLSQFCHVRREYVRKPLRQRWHVFPDGTRVQRDLYSAWLARSVEGNTLDVDQTVRSWSAADLLLRTASSCTQPARVRGLSPRHGPRSVGAGRPREGIPVRAGERKLMRGAKPQECGGRGPLAAQAVGVERSANATPGTPGLQPGE